jgi:leader peptidase (prepilin peptidase)/N-methyltransferase
MWYFGGIVFFFGACWGSFMNVCIWRIPRDESVVFPRSHCPKCEKLIAWYDNVPLVSWLALRGKCRNCALPISPRYITVEFITAVLFLAVWMLYGPFSPIGAAVDLLNSFVFVGAYFLMVFGLVMASYIDIDHMYLPDRVTKGSMVLGVILSFAFPVLQSPALGPIPSHWGGLLNSVLGLLMGGGILWGVAILGKFIFKKDAMGFGDVKLMAGLGAYFGWQSVPFILFVSSLIGAIAGMLMIACGKKDLQSKIPFGPYIAFAALFWMLGGFRLWHWYLDFMTVGL